MSRLAALAILALVVLVFVGLSLLVPNPYSATKWPAKHYDLAGQTCIFELTTQRLRSSRSTPLMRQVDMFVLALSCRSEGQAFTPACQAYIEGTDVKVVLKNSHGQECLNPVFMRLRPADSQDRNRLYSARVEVQCPSRLLPPATWELHWLQDAARPTGWLRPYAIRNPKEGLSG